MRVCAHWQLTAHTPTYAHSLQLSHTSSIFLVLSTQIVSAVTGESNSTFDTGAEEDYDAARIIWSERRDWFLLAYYDGRIKLYGVKEKTPLFSWRFPDDMICHMGYDGVHFIFCGFTNIYIIDFLQLKDRREQRAVLYGHRH